MVDRDDWRLMGQERYLMGVSLRWKPYYRWSEDWTHDHCEFCGTRFVAADDPYRKPNDLHDGYAVLAHRGFPDDYRWICEACRADFEGMFGWELTP